MCNLYSLTKGQAAIVARAMMRWGMAAVESHDIIFARKLMPTPFVPS
jgi:hypothetical protein